MGSRKTRSGILPKLEFRGTLWNRWAGLKSENSRLGSRRNMPKDEENEARLKTGKHVDEESRRKKKVKRLQMSLLN